MDKEQTLESNTQGHSEQLLLAQFTEMSQDWRHADLRIDAAVNLYVGVWTLFLTGAAVLYGEQVDNTLLLRLAGVAAVILFFLGFYTAQRVTKAVITRDRRLFAVNLVREFFKLRNPEIGPFIPRYVRTPEPLRSKEDRAKLDEELKQLPIEFPNEIVYFIYALNTLLVAFISIVTIQLFPNLINTWVLIIIFCAAVLAYQHFFYTRIKSRHLQKDGP